MNLTSFHIAQVKDKLAGEELLFDDFEAEMLDHICTALELKYSDSDDFDVALHNEYYSFQDHFVENDSWIEPNVYYTGIKAFEMERFKSLSKNLKRAFKKEIATQLITWRGLVWIPLAALLILLSMEYGLIKVLINSFKGGSISGVLLGFNLATLHHLFGNMPMYRAQRYGLYQVFKGIHQWMKPKNARIHAFRKLLYFPVYVLTILFNLVYWDLLFLDEMVGGLCWVILLSSFSLWQVHKKVVYPQL